MEELTRAQKAMLYVLGTLDELKTYGLISGPKTLSYEGEKAFENLREEGFLPTDEEMTSALNCLSRK